MVYSASSIAGGCCLAAKKSESTVAATAPETEGAGLMASAYLDSLSAKHAQLENVIFEEMQRPQPDSIRVAQWKKEKLRIKEQLERQTRH